MAIRTVSKPTQSVCDAPVTCCPSCGALECLCRPRFFAGQLLSEQDMNRLNQYIKNKNRLHNRNQHGWGVVNGLLALCDPCGKIKVTEGYAIDPCGDDIIVCDETAVDICDLIGKCKKPTNPNCEPFHQPPNTNCDDLEEEWVLTIQYEEWASRGVTALRGSSCATGCCANCGNTNCSCGSSCSCGGGSSGSCSCGANGSSAKPQLGAPEAVNRGAPPECEPTVVCEGYSFGVYPKPVDEPESDDDGRLIDLEGAFWDAFNCCAEPLMATIPPTPQFNDAGNIDDSDFNAATQWCCQFKANLTKYFSTHRNTSCEILEYINAIVCPNINNSENFINDYIRSFLQLISAWAEGLKNCLCLSLLPPPPNAACDTRVALATVRVRARDCKIISICNWTTERKILVTWPAVGYWLSVVPIVDFIRRIMDTVCCRSFLGIFDDFLQDLPGSTDSTNAQPGGDSAALAGANTQPQSFASALHQSSAVFASGLNFGLDKKIGGAAKLAASIARRGSKPVELGAILNAVSPRFKLPDNGNALTRIESQNIPLVLVSEIAIKPALGVVLGKHSADKRIKDFQRSLGVAHDADIEHAEQRIDELRAKLKAQSTEIDSLLKQLNK